MWSSIGLVRGLVASGSKDSNDIINYASTVHFFNKKAVLKAAHKHNAINGAAWSICMYVYDTEKRSEAQRTFGSGFSLLGV
jgi:hypothetical protein